MHREVTEEQEEMRDAGEIVVGAAEQGGEGSGERSEREKGVRERDHVIVETVQGEQEDWKQGACVETASKEENGD